MAEISTTRAASEIRRQQIVDAALQLAQDQAPEAISTQAIADAAGISQGGLFRHFPTKDAIWAAAVGWVREHFLAAIDAAAEAEADPLRKLEAMFLAHAQFVFEHPAMPRLVFHELQRPIESALRAEVRSVLVGYRSRVMKELQASMASGRVPASLNLSAGMTMYIGMIQGLVMQSAIAEKQNRPIPAARELFSLYLRAIGADK